MHGNWGSWVSWPRCPVSCGGAAHGNPGKQTRIRHCDNPAPSPGGDACTADGSNDTESQICNQNQCPGKQRIDHEKLQ